MNSKKENYYPVIGYTLLLLVVWILSWLVDIVATFMDVELHTESLISSEGTRWAMRNAVPALNNVPWGEIMLFISALGLLKGAGIITLFSHIIKREKLTKMEIHSLVFAVFALLLYCFILYIATFSQWNILLGVNGTIENSAFYDGLPLLIFIGILIVSLVYGFMYGNYRSSTDVISFIGKTFVCFVPALIAMIPAAGVISSIDYIGIFNLLEVEKNEADIIIGVFYSIPFLHVIGKEILNHRKS